VGRLAGFRYREVVRKLKACGFQFDRQAAGSHEIWYNPSTDRYTTVPNHPGDMPEGTLRAILKQASVNPETFLQVDADCDKGRNTPLMSAP
jgi:predicted RNA binding protein YcfA (HicA-like mRNA interferase family)